MRPCLSTTWLRERCATGTLLSADWTFDTYPHRAPHVWSTVIYILFIIILGGSHYRVWNLFISAYIAWSSQAICMTRLTLSCTMHRATILACAYDVVVNIIAPLIRHLSGKSGYGICSPLSTHPESVRYFGWVEWPNILILVHGKNRVYSM
jgi:hypothetical protein